MGCATTSVKITFIVLNAFLAFLATCTIILVAIYAVTGTEESMEIGIVTYVVCSIILLFAILGIVAAIRESVGLTITYVVLLILLAVGQVVFTIQFLHQFKVMSGTEAVDAAWQANAMDELQQEYECCGKTSSQDYVHLGQPIPSSCYADQKQAKEHLFIEGCIEQLQIYYESVKQLYIICSWVQIGFELLCFVMAIFLAISYRNKQRRMQF